MSPALQLPEGHLIHIGADNFVVGADPGCDLRLHDDKASPRHIIIQRVDGAWQVALLDLDATARLNDEPISGITRLKDGDVLKVGDTRLRWVEGEDAPPPLVKRSYWMLALLSVALFLMMGAGLALLVSSRQFQPPVVIIITATPTRSVVRLVVPTPAAELASTETPAALITATPIYFPLVGAEGTGTPGSGVGGVAATATPVFFPLVGAGGTETPTASVSGVETTATPIFFPLVGSGKSATATATQSTPTFLPLLGAGQTPAPSPTVEATVPVEENAAATPDASLLAPSPACPPPSGWTPVTVQEGETLYDIALRHRISRARLARGNCLLGYAIQPGETIYAPPVER